MTIVMLSVAYRISVEVDDPDPCADTDVLAVEQFKRDEQAYIKSADSRDIEVL